MSWQVVLALGIMFAKPVIKAVQSKGADRACKAAYRREVGNCSVTAEELDEIALQSEEDIRKFLEEKGLTSAQKEAALRYIDNHWYGAAKYAEAYDEIQKVKEWTEKMKSLREDQTE